MLVARELIAGGEPVPAALNGGSALGWPIGCGGRIARLTPPYFPQADRFR
jgi:hypothetical protein